jgi:hypothetical protein
VKIFDDTIYTHVTRAFRVEDGPALSGMYGSKSGRVERVRITYMLSGRTGEWEFQSAYVYGVVLKADQTDSKNAFSHRVGTYDLRDRPMRWGWLTTLIKQARPTAAPVFPSPFEGKEV